jgi:hypothetical protein
MKREKKEQMTTKSSHMWIFINWTFKLDLIPLHTLNVPYQKNLFLIWRWVQFKSSICSNLVLGILDPRPLYKVALTYE